jgi:hypothetical protein
LRRRINHDDPEFEYANCVSITFERQKKDKSNGLRNISLPRLICSSNCKKNRKYPGTSQNSPISSVFNHGIIAQVTFDHLIDTLRDMVGAIGEARLGIKKEDVCAHSIRLGAAMAMYLSKCPVFMIMLIGRWSSDAFLCYICKQVMEFSQNVAKMMLSCQNFRHIPVIHLRIPTSDPHIQNHPANAKTRRNVGGDSHHHVRLPPFAQFS